MYKSDLIFPAYLEKSNHSFYVPDDQGNSVWNHDFALESLMANWIAAFSLETLLVDISYKAV